MLLKVPGHFTQTNEFKYLKIKDAFFVEFHQYKAQIAKEVLLTEHVIVLVLQGAKIIHNQSGGFRINAGQAIFLKRGSYVMSEVLTDDTLYASLMFFFNEKLVREFVGMHQGMFTELKGQPTPGDYFGLPMTDSLERFKESMLFYLNYQSTYLPELMRLKFHELLLLTMQADREGHFLSLLHEIYAGSKVDLPLLLENYLVRALPLAELARLSGRSLASFKRDFQASFGVPPGIWLKKKRLERADFLLAHTEESVSEVAFEVGFESVSHFIKAYKENFGYTPSRRRTQNAMP